MNLCRRFRDDDRGAFIAIFGILAIVLIAAAGAVVDYTSMEQARTRAQVALDAAALALQASIYTKNETWLQQKAQAVLTERLADTRITGTVTSAAKNVDAGEITLDATVEVPMSFVTLVGIQRMTASLRSMATRGSKNIEVALALDITYSMLGDKIDDLIDATVDLIDQIVQTDQSPKYSKMALVPYSNAVNLGSYAAAARGPVQDYTAISDAQWYCGSPTAYPIAAITKAGSARIQTTVNHGLTTGQQVFIGAIAGASGFTAINSDAAYTVTVVNSKRFTIAKSTSGISGSYTANSGRVSVCDTRSASAVSKNSQARITTPIDHGLITGDVVYLSGASGGGFTGLNGREVMVTKINDREFSVPVNSNYYSGTYAANSLVIRKCLTPECEVRITSGGHGMSDNEVVRITSVGGMTQLNNNYFQVSDATADSYVLEDSDGPELGTYTSGGRSYCVTYARNCAYYWYENNDRDMVLAPISNCVSERIGAKAYTEDPPQTDDQPPIQNWVGNVYPNVDSGSLGLCPGEQIIPLTSNKTLLKDEVEDYTVEGSTAGQIGLAWAWYALSPEFSYMWPADRGGADYDEPDLVKVVILMTDGAFNTAYCNGVISQNYGLASFGWGDDNRINCDATNGDPFDQAEALCTAIKKGGDGQLNTSDDIQLYTVAFDLGNDADAIDLMADCATSSEHSYTADDGDELAAAFESIGNNIAALRIAS